MRFASLITLLMWGFIKTDLMKFVRRLLSQLLVIRLIQHQFLLGKRGICKGSTNTGDAFVVGIKNTVSNDGEWELTLVNQWVVAIKETEVLGYKPETSQ